MADQVYKLLELTGTSDRSTDHAIMTAIERAAMTVRNMRWFEVVETRGAIENGKVSAWQVTIKVGFRLEEGT